MVVCHAPDGAFHHSAQREAFGTTGGKQLVAIDMGHAAHGIDRQVGAAVRTDIALQELAEVVGDKLLQGRAFAEMGGYI